MHKIQCSGANQKRKRNVLTVELKIEVLQLFERNKDVAERAKHIAKQTVCEISRKKAGLQSFVPKSDSAKAISDRKTLKPLTWWRNVQLVLTQESARYSSTWT